MNRTKSILLAGGAVLLSVAATSRLPAFAEAGTLHAQGKVVPDPQQTAKPLSDAQKQAIQDLQEKLDTLQAEMPKAPPPGKNNKKANSAFSARMSKFQSDLDDAKKSLSELQSGKAGGGGKGDAAAGPKGTNSASSNTTTSIPSIPNSDSNYEDDILRWDMPIHVYPTGATGGIDLNSKLCLPAKVKVVGLTPTFTSATPEGSQTAQNFLPVRLHIKGTSQGPIAAQVQAPDTTSGSSDSKSGSASDSAKSSTSPRMCDQGQRYPLDAAHLNAVDPDKTFVMYDDTQVFVNAQDLENTSLRQGWDFGTLVVPFKFQMSDKSIVTGSATLGGYVGYNIGLNMPGFRLSPVAFVGVSDVTLPQSSGSGSGGSSKSSSDTTAGLSYGVGLMGTIKDKFNISLVFGADHVSSKNYQYQDKPWVSFALGYSFTK